MDLLPESRRESFIDRVFYNIKDVYAVNSKLGESLLKRQQTYSVIPEVGDIFLEHVVNFAPFVLYGANQIEAKYEFEHEKSMNSAFSKFVEVRRGLSILLFQSCLVEAHYFRFLMPYVLLAHSFFVRLGNGEKTRVEKAGAERILDQAHNSFGSLPALT